MWTTEWRIIWRKIIAVVYATHAVAKRKPCTVLSFCNCISCGQYNDRTADCVIKHRHSEGVKRRLWTMWMGLKHWAYYFLDKLKIRSKCHKIAQYMELQQFLEWDILYWPRMGLCCLYLKGFQMEKTGELAMWDKQPKSNLLLKSKIKNPRPKA